MKLLICLPAFVFALLLALLPSPVSAQALCTSTGEIFFHMVDCCGNGMVDAASCKGESPKCNPFGTTHFCSENCGVVWAEECGEAAQANSHPQTMPASFIATSCSRATNLDINVWLRKKLEEKATVSAKLVAKN